MQQQAGKPETGTPDCSDISFSCLSGEGSFQNAASVRKQRLETWIVSCGRDDGSSKFDR